MSRVDSVSFLTRAAFFSLHSLPDRRCPVPMQWASVLFPSNQNGRSVILGTNYHAVKTSYVPTRHGAAALTQTGPFSGT
jgi:hypothetical protein